MNDDPIYTVTAMWLKDRKVPKEFVKRAGHKIEARIMTSRVFGFFHTVAEARLAIKKNQGGMHECLYNAIVLEEAKPGIHRISSAVEFYAWDSNSSKWVKSTREKLHISRGLINFSLG